MPGSDEEREGASLPEEAEEDNEEDSDGGVHAEMRGVEQRLRAVEAPSGREMECGERNSDQWPEKCLGNTLKVHRNICLGYISFHRLVAAKNKKETENTSQRKITSSFLFGCPWKDEEQTDVIF